MTAKAEGAGNLRLSLSHQFFRFVTFLTPVTYSVTGVIRQVSSFTFLDPEVSYPLPDSFDFEEYIDTERELWAFFPETVGKRVNFCQLGLTARLYAEVPE